MLFWFILAIHGTLWLVLLSNLVYLRRRRLTQSERAYGGFVSIIVPARNEGHNLPRLLSSLLSQKYRQFEIILYDDESTDNTGAVLEQYSSDPRLTIVRGGGPPPPGWTGKVHALYEATRIAQGDLLLFLDADVEFEVGWALASIVDAYNIQPERSVVTAFPRYAGGGLLLVSLIPHTFLTGLPWSLVRTTGARSLGAVNGQLWAISSEDYFRLEPHLHVWNRVLEDVQIGRYLQENGVTPVMVDVSGGVTVHMYDRLNTAWHGFRKNAYLLMGGSPIPFFFLLSTFALAYWLCAFVSEYFLVSVFAQKFVSDRMSRVPARFSLVAPLSFVMASVLQLDSAFAHWTNRVRWKGRNVGPRGL